MIDFDSALKFVLENSGRTKACSVAVKDCAGHFLAEGVKARCDLPRFSSSAMDGYCVKICDTQNASAEKPVRLKIQSKVNAGFKADIALKKGGAFYISTGAKMPDGVDAVVRKEDVETDGDFIAVKKQASKADNIRFKGEEYKKGDIVAEKGSLITPALAGLFVSFGLKRVRVYKKPVVSLIATGSELVPSGKKLMDFQIYESSSTSIGAALKQEGIGLKFHGIAGDSRKTLFRKVKDALKESEILLLTGGVSVGEADYVKGVFEELGVEKIFWRVAIKPGMPLFFGKKGQKLVFGLPGNPVASLTNLELFVKPAIKKMMGEERHEPLILAAVLENNLRKKTERLEFVRGFVRASKDGSLFVTSTKGQESHMLGGLSNANCLILFPENERELKKGSTVKIHLLL